MAHINVVDNYHPASLPDVKKIEFSDLSQSLREGFEDFKNKPSYVFFLGVIYPIIGLFLGRAFFGYSILSALFPLVAGFALVGPLAALGFYEVSRRREQGLDTSWGTVFSLLRSKAIGSITALGVLLMILFLAWIWTANIVYSNIFHGQDARSLTEFWSQVTQTPEGAKLILIGNAIGFLFAFLIFSISVVSFPLIIDKNVSAPVAIVTSVKAVLKNPRVMMTWAAMIAVLLVIGSIPFLMGLAIILPLLGHASWHLYRKTIVG